jgi:hypothetical protein
MSAINDKIHRRLVPFLVEGRINHPVLSATAALGRDEVTVVRVCVRDLQSRKKTETELARALSDLDRVVLSFVG